MKLLGICRGGEKRKNTPVNLLGLLMKRELFVRGKSHFLTNFRD